ncbi:MAG: SDR family oxidoreductase [Pseudomonadota bacterium]
MASILKGKVALVTGGSRNIGRETALAIANQGGDVVITYRSQKEAADEVVAEMQSKGARARALQVDFDGTSELDDLVASFLQVLDDWGRSDFDILVNNAGELRLGTFDRTSESDLDAMYNVNFKSPYFLTQKLAERIAEGGRIINLGSGTARIAFGPLISYGPLKAALQSLTLYWASYFGAKGITANAVAPGGLDDDFNQTLFDVMPQARDYITSNTAIGRIGVPSDVAGVIGFLCAPEASFVNGATINIDGGYHL